MHNLRKLSELWSTKTYRQGLEEANLDNKKLKEYTQKVFDSLHLLDIPMDGYSCEKLPKTEETRVAIKRTYSDVFHEEYSKDYFSPASYLINLINECYSSKTNLEVTKGTIARGLRTLTSLLREPDFAENLKQSLSEHSSKVHTSMNPKQDSSDHTDVLLQYNDAEYRIWLYQFSARGLPHDIERITGKRGELPNGTHILCPLHTEVAMEYEKLQKKVEKLSTRLVTYKKKLSECSERAVKKKEQLETQIADCSLQLDETKQLASKEYDISKQELDIVCGWFFYSPLYIDRVAKFILNINPISYDSVLEILLGPEKFVGKIQAFKK